MLNSALYSFLQKEQVELLVVKNDKDALVAQDIASFLDYDVFRLYDFRANIGDDLRSFNDEVFHNLSVLGNFYSSENSKKILISPFSTLLTKWPTKNNFSIRKLEFGQTVFLNELKESLLHWGYSFVDIIEQSGEVSFRGDIIDIFPTQDEHPIRISLFDTEIESIKKFDINTQKSVGEELESIDINPAFYALDEEGYNSLINKIDSESSVIVKDIASQGLWFLEDRISLIEEYKSAVVESIQSDIEESLEFGNFEVADKIILDLESIDESSEFKDIVLTDAAALVKVHQNKKVTVIAKNLAVVKQALIDEDDKYDVVYHDAIFNIMSEDELIISLNKKRAAKRTKRKNIVLDALKPGDYVVHENYGVALFKGIETVTVMGATSDFVALIYQGEDKLLVPTQSMDLIDRYVAEGGLVPTIDKLGKGGFVKLKEKVKKRLFEIASEIIKIAAERELVQANKIDCKNPEIKIFQEGAGFEYTQDQKESIKDIFTDLSSGNVMDRLLSGDVGFGKTEVAMNALMAVVKSGYQGAMVVPTTLLSSQHFKSIYARMKDFGIRVAKLDRFVTAKAKKELILAMKEHEVDVVIGTHALLDSEFKNLGLVVIDEEHKFGVKQKEKLKNLRSDVHVLAMSATPIPRTLNMALSTLKGYSELLTAPMERKGVRTFVKEYDEALIKEIILREQRRGGQVFYVYNRIATMEQKKTELQKIMPNLKILMLHSKISAAQTEKEMMNFENGEYDLLLSTSIVESGIHLPNVNTMLIDGANKFGISDLHQLRGRVGRGSKEGFCYFIVEDANELTEEATKRLTALESNSHLGSGAQLAFHDLEIRGGGNVIGEAQSGHIKNIGYGLYLKMLEDAIHQLRGNVQEEHKEVDIKLTVNAYINQETVSEERLRLDLYRRLSRCTNVVEVHEIEEEMIDRFKEIDEITKQFIDIIIMKIFSIELNISMIGNYQQVITVTYENGEKTTLKSPSKDDDDIIETVLKFLRREVKDKA